MSFFIIILHVQEGRSVGFEDFTAVNLKITVFSNVTPSSLAVKRFR
jgi:hypothetical protein